MEHKRWFLAVGFALILGATVGVVKAVAQSAFEVCSTGARTCVLDGDTLKLDGQRVRILNIDTPEINSPHCAAEAVLGFAAAERLAEMLNGATSWELRRDPAEPRDEDQYGRPLRLLFVDGRDAGAELIAEGLARPWAGRRESWCD